MQDDRPDNETWATTAMVTMLYSELRRIARRCIGPHNPAPTLQPTALIHEAFLRLSGPASSWNSRAHFLGAAAIAMRRILVEAARRRARRGQPGSHIAADDHDLPIELGAAPEDLLTLDEALDRLKVTQPRQAEVVTLRYFGGLDEEQVAELLGVHVRTVRRDWQLARLTLARAFRARNCPSG